MALHGPPAPAGDSEAGGGARAIGDPSLKPFVSAAPAVTSVRLGPGPSTLIMGSDGLWDVVAPSVRAARGRPRAVQCPQGAPDLRRGRIAARRSWPDRRGADREEKCRTAPNCKARRELAMESSEMTTMQCNEETRKTLSLEACVCCQKAELD